MSALAPRDAERVLRFLGYAEELGGDHAFTPELLEELGKLIRADEVTYCELDRVRQRDRYVAMRPGDEWQPTEAPYWEISQDYPTCHQHDSGDFRALKLSDFIGLRQLRKTRIYALWFRPANIEREISVPIPSPPWHTKTFHPRPLLREPRLQRAGPHGARPAPAALRAALARRRHPAPPTGGARRSRRRVGARGAWSDRAHLGRPDCVCLPAGTAPAARLRRRGAGAGAACQDCGLGRVRRARPGDHRRRLPRHRQAERRRAPARGETRAARPDPARKPDPRLGRTRQTNREVAELLWIAPTTVRKHLENVYAKLGVTTRTAAVARFLGVLDA